MTDLSSLCMSIQSSVLRRHIGMSAARVGSTVPGGQEAAHGRAAPVIADPGSTACIQRPGIRHFFVEPGERDAFSDFIVADYNGGAMEADGKDARAIPACDNADRDALAVNTV
jgi:hypothetical protein